MCLAGTTGLVSQLFCHHISTAANSPWQVLLRKGGIKEPTFKPAASQFLLFPTAFHTDAQLLKPEAAQKYGQVGVQGCFPKVVSGRAGACFAFTAQRGRRVMRRCAMSR